MASDLSSDRRDNTLLNLIYDEVKTTHAVASGNGETIAAVKADVTTLKQDNRDQWERINGNKGDLATHKERHPVKLTVGNWIALIAALAAIAGAAAAFAPLLQRLTTNG